jgi:hypothetical protein
LIIIRKYFKNFSRVIQPNGYLYIHTPQPNQKRIFGSLKSWHHEDHIVEGYMPSELKIELERVGFKVVEMRNTFGYFGKLSWELNHMMLGKNLVLAGITYPILYIVAKMDLLQKNSNGLATAILAKKVA